MPLENPVYISDLVPSNPAPGDPASQGDDHIRGIKTALKATFANVAGAITLSDAEINALPGVIAASVAAEAAQRNAAIANEATQRSASVAAEANARSTQDLALQTNINTEANNRYTADTALQAGINNEASIRNSQDTSILNLFASYLPIGAIGLNDNHNGTFYFNIPTGGGYGIRVAFGNVGLAGANQQAWSFGVNFGTVMACVVTCTSPGHHVETQVRDTNSGFAWAYDNAGNVAPNVGFHFIVIGTY